MINHNHKFIFTRVTKTGSSTLVHSLKKCGVNMNRVITSAHWNGDLNHIPLWFLKKKIPTDKFDSYFKFGFVRNPWDRMVSAYYYIRAH